MGGGGREGTPPGNTVMIMPPLDAPKSLRGTVVEVTFTIDATGRVTDLGVEPPIKDRKFARVFDQLMREYLFTPATDADGTKVPGVYVVAVTF